jgi:hypothetical protein
LSACRHCASILRRRGTEGNTVVREVYSRTFRRAAEFCGGVRKLARHLRVPVRDLEKWIAGEAAPPMAMFLKTVDLVLAESTPRLLP